MAVIARTGSFHTPFASTAWPNVPIGSGATRDATSSQKTIDLRTGGANWKYSAWSHPPYDAGTSSPFYEVRLRAAADRSNPNSPGADAGMWSRASVVTFFGTIGDGRIRIPAGAEPSPNPGVSQNYDRHMHVHWLGDWYELYAVRIDHATRRVLVNGYALYDAEGTAIGSCSNETRASGVAAMAGLLRLFDLNYGQILHTLVFAMPGPRMLLGPVWPATCEDGFADELGNANHYKNAAAAGYDGGGINMGSRVCLPPNLVYADLGISTEGGEMAFDCLQNFGAVLVDQSSAWGFYAEPSVAGNARFNEIVAVTGVLQDNLVRISNTSSGAPGGGGTPRTTDTWGAFGDETPVATVTPAGAWG